ncbi:MAG: anti-sigma factor [bacterium]|nr:anti-sigma factor [bacterium]
MKLKEIKKLNNSGNTMVVAAVIVVILIITIGAYVLLNNDEVSAPSTSNETVSEQTDESSMLQTDVAQLSAVGEYTGSGEATRTFDLAGPKFFHDVIANIPDPAEGKFYEGWLVNNGKFFSTGKLEKNGEQYILNYVGDKDYPDHNLVVITEETEANGLDNKPEAHVLEGSF